MTRDLETGQETGVRKLECAQSDLLAIVDEWLGTNNPERDEDGGLEMIEVQKEILQLEMEIRAFHEGFDRAIISASWKQEMFPEIAVIPIDEDEIPF